MKPAVTFVIPVFNGLPFLHEAIASIRNQTSTHWSLLLVDDASTDGSFEALTQYLDLRTAACRNSSNLGLYPSLAAAVEKVESEWVSILMQDDRLRPTYLEEMLMLAKRHCDVPVVWATEDVIGTEGQLLKKGRDTCRTERIEPAPDSWLSVLMRGCIWTISGSFTRADFLRQLPFRADLPHCGDYEWLLRAIRISPLLYYERPLAELREHSGRASAANLADGRNVREAYSIIAENLRLHAADATFGQALSICSRRAIVAFRQMLGASAHGRAAATGELAKHVVRFAWLPISYSYGRSHNHGGVA